MEEALIRLVWERAAFRCEYCLMPQAHDALLFQIDHIIAVQHGGLTRSGNLALACFACNLTKAERTTGEDDSGRIQPLFNPRDFEPWLLGWYLHFALDHNSGMIVPRTPTGEATVRTLKMNDSIRVFARKLQILARLIA